MAKQIYDLAICGTGPVGLLLAGEFGRRGRRVALIGPKPAPPKGEAANASWKVLVLLYRTRQLFEAWDLWPQIRAAAAPLTELRLKVARFPLTSSLGARDAQVPALAYSLPYDDLTALLASRLEGACIDQLPTRALGLDQDADGAHLSLEGGGEISARLVVGADGANSSIRGLMGLSVSEKAYGSTVFVGDVACDRPAAGVGWELFTASGVLALLPVLDRGRRALIWTLDQSEEQSADPLAALEEGFRGRLGTFSDAVLRSSFPLRTLTAEGVCRGRGLLIGDAALALHPIGGQGLNLAFRDCAELLASLEEVADCGQSTLLSSYVRSRMQDRWSTSIMVDALGSVAVSFGRGGRALRQFMPAAVAATSMLRPLRSILARRFIGAAAPLRLPPRRGRV